MKSPIKYIILLLAGGMIIPLYYYTGAAQTAPVISPVKHAAPHRAANKQNSRKSSITRELATKLLPVLKYF